MLIARPGKPTSRLILVPITHTETDLGSIARSLREFYIGRAGREEWQEHVRTVGRLWRRIRTEIEGQHLEYAKVRLYQDGLPECGREAEILRQLARSGSQNHQLLPELMSQGATLTGSQSPELLLEEYELAQQILVSLAADALAGLPRSQRELSRALPKKRDQYIAHRIDETLEMGETGLILLGLLHSLAGVFPPSIQMRHLCDRARPSR